MKKIIKKLIGALPDFFEGRIYRGLFKLPDFDLASDVIFKIAETQDELEQAFALLHDCYVESGSMRPHPSRLRVTPFVALPTTTTLIAKKGAQVLATLSIVRSSTFGIPLEKVFDLTQFKQQGMRIAEFSSLAVHPLFRGRQSPILFLLLKFAYLYCRNFFGIDVIFAGLKSHRVSLYRHLFGFKKISKDPVKNYHFANNCTIWGLYLKMDEADQWFSSHYNHRSPHQNFYRFFVHRKEKNFLFPQRFVPTISDPVMTPSLLDYFFNRRTQSFKDLTNQEILCLHCLYPRDDYKKVFPPLRSAEFFQLRHFLRFDVHCQATVLSSTQAFNNRVEVLEVSSQGLKVRSCFDLPRELTLKVSLGAGSFTKIKAKVRKKNRDLTYFLFLDAADASWHEFLQILEKSSLRKGTLSHVA